MMFIIYLKHTAFDSIQRLILVRNDIRIAQYEVTKY